MSAASPHHVFKKTWCWDDDMEIQQLKERSRKRMAIAAEYESDDNDPLWNSGDDIALETSNRPLVDTEKVVEKYEELQQNISLENNYNSYLLPSFLPSRSNVTVTVKGIDDVALKAATEVSANSYINTVVEERNVAAKTMLMYRDMVEDLRSKNRKLYCTMNDSIDSVRKFWRNNILEGGSRGGVCVKRALEMVKIS